MKTQLEKIQELYRENDVLKERIQRIKMISTTKGFIKLYYKQCQTAKSCKEAFYEINDEYEEIYNEPKFKSYNSFKRTLNYHINQNKT